MIWSPATQMFKEKCQSITLVFDREIIRKTTFRRWTILPNIFIGSLVPTQHPDLWDIPLERSVTSRTPSGRRPEFIAPRRKFSKETYDRHHPQRALLQGQIRGIRQHLAKRTCNALRDLQKRIARSP